MKPPLWIMPSFWLARARWEMRHGDVRHAWFSRLARRWGLAVLALGFLWSTCGVATATYAAPEDFKLRMSGGVVAGKAADVDVQPLPFMSIEVGAPLTDFGGPRLTVDVKLAGLPGRDPELGDPTTVKALDGSAGLLQGLGPHLGFSAYAKAGIATRLTGADDTSARLPGYASFGFDFRSEDGDHYLQLGLGPDQRLDGRWATCIHAEGRVRAYEKSGARLYVSAGVIRALDLARYGYRTPARDWWWVGMSVGN